MSPRVVPPGFRAMSAARRRQVAQQGGRGNAGQRRVALVTVRASLAKLALAAQYAAEACAELDAAFAPLEVQGSDDDMTQARVDRRRGSAQGDLPRRTTEVVRGGEGAAARSLLDQARAR